MVQSHLESTSNKTFANNDSGIDNSQIFEALPNKPIFTLCDRRKKKGVSEGWQKRENLLDSEEAQSYVERKYNIGIRLGEIVGYYGFVVLDVESTSVLPEEVSDWVDTHAILIWDSPHTGRNRLLKVTPEAFGLLDSLKTQYSLTDSDAHDIEFLTSGHALCPPSRIDHKYCNDAKDGCMGTGCDSYELVSINPNAPLLTESDARKTIDDLGIDTSSSTSKTVNSSTKITEEDDIPEAKELLNSGFDPREHFRKNVPRDSSNGEGYPDRLDWIINGNLENREEVDELLYGYYNDRSYNELKLRSHIAWAFSGDKKMVQWFFEFELPRIRDKNSLKYNENKYHRKDVLNFEEYVNPPYYHPSLSFELRYKLAEWLCTIGEIKTSNLSRTVIKDTGSYGRSQITTCLNLFEAEGLIQWDKENGCVEIVDTDSMNTYIDNIEMLGKKYQSEYDNVDEDEVDRGLFGQL